MPSDYEKICQDNIRRRGEEFDDIGHLISEQLYSEKSHFIYELLQNAEDALERRFRQNPNNNSPCKVQFRLFQDRLEFRHFGAAFNLDDVKGISDVLKGTKKEDFFQIGKFGIGFKSVYAFTASPEIHSGEEHFVVKRYIRPEAKEPGLSIAEGETVFNFLFDHKELSAGDAFDLILKKLRVLGPRVLLFLRRIDEIEWSVEPNGETGQYLKESKGIEKVEKVRRVTVIGQKNDQNEDENWLIFERSVPVPDGSYHVCVEVGFRLETSTKDEMEGITRVKDAPLVVYFEIGKATRFGFLIQGPYRTTPSRDNITNDDWNKTLVKETAHLLTDVLPNLKELGLLTVSLLETLPIRMEDFSEDSMFYPIVAAVREALMIEDLLPADDGTFVSARNAKLVSAKWLRKLLPEEQLRQLFKTEDPLKHISGEVTEGAKRDLWKFIREELKVEEVTPDSFARKVDLRFFEKQTDEWFIDLYMHLVDQNALWKKCFDPRWDEPGPLRAKPFIRLQDGSHVKPFRDGDLPNAYLSAGTNNDTSLPIVRVVLTEQEDARRFLNDLGIPELDIVAEVIDRILPKYAHDADPVPIDEHWRDLTKIEKAFKTDSQEKKERLRKRLVEIPFILIEKSDIDTPRYGKPTGVYFLNDELKEYFSGNRVGFVSSEYRQSTLDIFESLGVSNEVRIKCQSLPGSSSWVALPYKNGYRRGLKRFDPQIEVDELEFALRNPTISRSEIIWNKIAIPYNHCIKGKVLRCSRQDFSPNAGTYKEEELISNFGQLLINAPWLPRLGGGLVKPSEINLDDLPEFFIRNEILADLLGMKKDVVAKLAEQVGVSAEDIELLKQHPEEFREWKATIAARNEKPLFPTRTVANPERRQERLAEQRADALKKKYEERKGSVRTTRDSVDPALWLRNQYTNDAGQMVCQICKEEMPFRKRDGEYYFEAVEALSNVYFSREHEAQFLALCPLCAARYKEFVKQDEGAMESFKNVLMNSDEPEISLQLGDLNTSVRFVESHWQDMKTILQEKG